MLDENVFCIGGLSVLNYTSLSVITNAVQSITLSTTNIVYILLLEYYSICERQLHIIRLFYIYIILPYSRILI